MLRKLFFLFTILFTLNGNTQTHQWVMPLGGDWFDFGHAVFVDDSGYVYSTGQFSSTTDFDPKTNGWFNINSNGFYDIYVHKADSAGNLVWAKSMGGSSHDSGESIVVDDSGNVYTTGRFLDTVDFDPGPGVFKLSSNNTQDIFVQKLDRHGNFLWAISLDGNASSAGNSILLDDSNNLIITGYYTGILDFDPDTSSFILNSAANPDAFILKLDASGNFIWVKTIDGISSQVGMASAIDSLGNIYTTGFYRGTADFNPDTAVYNLTAVNSEDVFIQKLDPSGNFLWAKTIGGVGDERAESISVNAQGSLVITGHFSNQIDLNPDPSVTDTASSGGDVDIFIAKLDSQGNYLWGTATGDSRRDRGESVVQDVYGNVYVIGQFGSTVDFDPGTATANLTYAGGFDIFILKLDAAGNFNWVQSVGSFYGDVGKGIFIDAQDNIYTTGYFEDQVDFDPGSGVDSRLAAGWNDIFVQKFGQLNNSVRLINEKLDQAKISAYPNPVINSVQIRLAQTIENVELEIFDSAGKVVYKNFFNTLKQTTIPLNHPDGVYFLSLRTRSSQSIIKLIKE